MASLPGAQCRLNDGPGSAISGAAAGVVGERGRQVDGVIAEAVADAIDGHAAALAGVEQGELDGVEAKLREHHAEQADRQVAAARLAVELEDDAVEVDVDAGRGDRLAVRDGVE